MRKRREAHAGQEGSEKAPELRHPAPRRPNATNRRYLDGRSIGLPYSPPPHPRSSGHHRSFDNYNPPEGSFVGYNIDWIPFCQCRGVKNEKHREVFRMSFSAPVKCDAAETNLLRVFTSQC